MSKLNLYTFKENIYFDAIAQYKKIDFNKVAIDASHHMGGTCYNPDRKISFVDKQLKIIGLKKTYICSSSVFPT